MTTLDTRPAVIDGTATETDRQPNPHRFGMYAASTILLGAGTAMLLAVDGTDLEKGGAMFALLVALTVWLRQLFRFNQRAQLGDR